MSAATALDPLCRGVGLSTSDRLDKAADGAALWLGPYASVLLWPATEADLADTTNTAEAWFGDLLLREEDSRSARVLDGYLLICLPAKPPETLEPVLRSIELSTRICRKHVVWPEADGEWRRFDSVTVLRLPEGVTSVASDLQWPTLSNDGKAMWADIQDRGGVAAAQAEEKRA